MQLEMFPASSPMEFRFGADWDERSLSEQHSDTFGGFKTHVMLRRTPHKSWWCDWRFERPSLSLSSVGRDMLGPFDTCEAAVDAAAREILVRVVRRHRDQAMLVIQWLKVLRGRTVQ